MSWTSSKFFGASSAKEGASARSMQTLVAEHYQFVWRSLRGLGLSSADAEDAAQQVFMITARKLDTLLPGRERSFIYGATLRVASNARRSVRRRREVPEEEQSHEPEPECEGPEHHTQRAEARALLSEILAQLPEVSRRVLILAEIQQLEVAEIAALERLPVGTAASRLRRAREQFRALLEASAERNPFLTGHDS